MNKSKNALRKAAQIILVLIAVTMVVTFVAALIDLLSRPAHAAEAPWQHFCAAPYAASQKDACRKAAVAIDGFNMPSAAKEHFKAVLGAVCNNGTTAYLAPDQQLEQMWSGPDAHHKMAHLMNNVPVAELPVQKSPDGRLYRKDSVFETPKALSWSWDYEGKTYALYLPFVCFNWSWAVTEHPCATLVYTVKPGDLARFAVFTAGRDGRLSDTCWQLCDGDVCSAPPSPCQDCNWSGPFQVIPTGYEPNYTGLYVAHSAKQTLRLPLDVMTNYIALCVDRDGLGESDSWIVQPSAWVGTKIVSVPYGGQHWPAWGEVDMSRWAR